MELLPEAARADSDGRLTQARAETYRILVSRIARSEGQSPEEYAAALVRSEYDAAVKTAMRDAGEGVEALGVVARGSRLLAPLMGGEFAAVFDAAIGYQTAAALRELGRRDEAVAAYDGVVERHSGSAHAAVQYWLGMCLVNCAQLLLEPEGALNHSSARGHAFALVAQMFDELGASEDPKIRVRLVRAAVLEVSSLVAIGRVAEASEAFQRFEPHLAADDAETRQGFERWRCVVGQTDDGPVSEDLLRAGALSEEGIWQGLEWLARETDPEYVASVKPELLTDRTAALLGEAETELPEDQAKLLRRGWEKLQPIAARGPNPSLDGPIEGLAWGVGVRFSLETACDIARRPHFVRTLAQPYVDILCVLCESQLDNGDWRRAWQLAMVLRATAQRLPVGEPRDFMLTRIGVTLLRVAETAWASVPDRRTYDTALKVGEELFALSAQYDDAVGAGMVHELLARMLLAPYVRDGMGKTQYFSSVRRWRDRLAEDVTNQALDLEPGRWEIPLFADDLERAEAHVRAALAALPAEHSVGPRVLLQDAYVLRQRWAGDSDVRTQVAEAETMLNVLGGNYVASPDIALRALLHLESLGAGLTPKHLTTVLDTSPTEVREQWGDAVVRRSLLPATILALTVDRNWGLQLLDDHRELIESAEEDVRLHLLRLEWLLLTSPRPDLDFDDLASGPIEQKLADIDERARTQGWPGVERTRIRLLAAALRLEVNAEGPDDEQALLELWAEEAKKLVGEHESAMEVSVAAVVADVSTRAMRRGDWAMAIGWQAATIEAFLDMHAPDAALECLTLVDYCCGASEAGLGRPVVEALYPLALRLDVELGARATRLLQRIWQRTLRREIASENPDGAVLLALLQLSKGLRFGAALQTDEAFDVAADETAAGLLSLVQQSEAQLEALGGDDDDGSDEVARWALDEFTLVTAYDEELDPLPNPTTADLLENLQRSFDARVQRFALGGERNHEPIFEQELAELLPESSALLLITFGHDMEDKQSFLWLLATAGKPLTFGSQPAPEQNLVVTVRGRQRLLDPVGAAAWTIRLAMQQDPAGKTLNPEGRSSVDQALDSMLGPGVGILRDLLEEGLSHLIVVPHGGLHFVPFPALHLDGRPLVEWLTVTTLPNLALLRPRPTARRAEEVRAIGLDFPDGAFGLPPLPEAVTEAQAVAELFGTEPLLPPDATESAMVSALQSATYVHLATHGEHAVPAPSFQRVYAIASEGDDGRLAAYELMRADLRGLRLVTLSACETALGRFDQADNVLGIPAVLLLRGAETVVGTLWEVETTVSQDFFVALYRGLRGDLPRSEAFVQAQREVRRTHPQYRDWAAFQLAGDWR
jgi:CHAT domain-containing protein